MDLLLVESLLDDYVSSNRMVEGTLMPSISELAKRLGWREYDVVRALSSASTKGRFVKNSEGWLVGRSNPRGQHGYSFARSAETHGNKLETHLIEVIRRPPTSDDKHPFYVPEMQAQVALGIERDSPFLMISRCRMLNGIPGAIQRVYLDPTRFPIDFHTGRHNFGTASLISIYELYGYKVFSRDTLLTARMPNQYESGLLMQSYKLVLHLTTPVIDAEQCLYAKDPTGQCFVLEYLSATYLQNWKYEISNRPA